MTTNTGVTPATGVSQIDPAGTVAHRLVSGGRRRTYLVRVPTHPVRPLAALISLHGSLGTAFLADLIAGLENRNGVSPGHVFLSGMSNGAFMVQRFAYHGRGGSTTVESAPRRRRAYCGMCILEVASSFGRGCVKRPDQRRP